jgi:xylulose-5-phosphate/fructose-6-phosphate phosphoketolase
MAEEAFVELFTRSRPVVFAFHGYQRAIHEILHGRPDPRRFHVRGFNEEGTTTTPFDMVVRNGISRYHLAAEVLRRSRRLPRTRALLDECAEMLNRHQQYMAAHFEDLPEVRDWTWSDGSPASAPAASGPD